MFVVVLSEVVKALHVHSIRTTNIDISLTYKPTTLTTNSLETNHTTHTHTHTHRGNNGTVSVEI